MVDREVWCPRASSGGATVSQLSINHLGEAGLAKDPATPREAVGVPARHGDERHSLAGGMDHPATPEIDAHVVDLGGRRAGTASAEEDEVCGAQALVDDALALGELCAHVVRRPAAQDVLKPRGAGERLQLVHAPDESGAVESSARRDSEERLRSFGGAAPDVGIADEAHGAPEHAVPPDGQRGEGEGSGEVRDVASLPLVEVEDLGEGEGSLGTVDDVLRPELAEVLGRSVVRAEREEADDHFGSEATRRAG